MSGVSSSCDNDRFDSACTQRMSPKTDDDYLHPSSATFVLQPARTVKLSVSQWSLSLRASDCIYKSLR